MENIIIGRYFLIFCDHDHDSVARAQIVDHIHGPYYYIVIFDMQDGTRDYHSVISLDNLQDMPFFSTVKEMDQYFNSIQRVERTAEVSH